MANPHLSDTELRIYNKLCKSGDVRISVLYRCVSRRWPAVSCSVRSQQMFLGPYFVRLNRKLRPNGFQVAPGVARNTYRLSQISKG